MYSESPEEPLEMPMLHQFQAPIDIETRGCKQQYQFQIILTTLFSGVFTAN